MILSVLCLLATCIYSLEKCLFKFFAHIKNCCLLLLSCIYILNTRYLWDLWFTNIFSHLLVVYIFNFLIASFDAQKFLIFMKFHLSTFCIAYAFHVKSKDPLPNLRSWSFIIMFCSKSFIAYVFDPFWVNFGMWYKERVQFHLYFNWGIFDVPYYVSFRQKH